jgi:ABC-type lipoprotein release transport system permease subunit
MTSSSDRRRVRVMSGWGHEALAATTAVLLTISITAAWLPVRRAARMDPGAVLRES